MLSTLTHLEVPFFFPCLKTGKSIHGEPWRGEGVTQGRGAPSDEDKRTGESTAKG
jgi:hypothetical protein